MAEALATIIPLICTCAALAALLLIVSRRDPANRVVLYWGYFWATQVVIYVFGIILYFSREFAEIGGLIVLVLVGFQVAFVVAAGRAVRGLQPVSKFLIWRGIGFSLLLALGLVGVLRLGVEDRTGAFVFVCNMLEGLGVAYFAIGLARHGGSGLGNRITTAVASVLALQDILFASAGLGYGPYGGIETPVAPLVAVILQLGLGFGIVVSVLEEALGHAMRASEYDRRFRTLLEGVHLLGVILDTEGRIVFANRFLLDLAGYDFPDVVERPWIDLFVPPNEREATRRRISGIAVGSVAAQNEGQFLTRAGLKRDILWTNTLLRAPNGSTLGCASLGFDLTEKRRLEEQAQQAQRLESIGRLTGGIAHDFNNYLTVITGYCDLIRRNTTPENPLRVFVDECYSASERATRLTRQLLAVGRRQVLDVQRICPAEMIGALGSMLRRLVREDIDLDLRPGAPDAFIDCDPAQFEQVVLNLVVNSRDAIDGAGKITVETATCEAPPGENGVMLPEGRYVRLMVRDNGSGMDKETQARVFEPFFTTKGASEGTGLGMAVVHGVVKQSGGFITIESAPGAGTAIRIYFPQSVRSAPAQPPTSEGPVKGSERILLLEERDDVRALARRVLSEAGYRVAECSSRDEARSLIESAKDRFDLLVAGTGREPDQPGKFGIRVLWICDHAPATVGPGGASTDGLSYLVKPYAPGQLLTKIREALEAA